jgi:hypothetical protein
VARARRQPDPPLAQQQQSPPPDSAWADKLAQAVEQLRGRTDALTAAQSSLATAGKSAGQAQAGLAGAVARAGSALAGAGGAGKQLLQSQQALGGALASTAAGMGAVGTAAEQPSRAMLQLAAASNAAEKAQEELTAAKAAAKADPTTANLARQATALKNAQKATEQLKAAEAKATGMAQGGLAVAAAYAYASSKLLGFVRAGLAGTTAGEALSHSVNQLQRQFASTFLPVIEKVIQRLQQAVTWFRSLSGDQQASIARWTGLTVGALGFMTLLPKLISGLSTVGTVLKVAALSNPFLLAAGGVVALMSRTEEGRDSLKEMGKALLGAFQKVAEILSDLLLPLIESLTSALSGPAAKIVLIGTLAGAVGVKVVAAFAAMKAAAIAAGAGIGAAFGLATLGVGALVVAVGTLLANRNRLREFEQEVGDIAKGVRSGQTSREQAQQMVTQAAQRRTFGLEETIRFGGGADFWKALSEGEQVIKRADINLDDRLNAFERAALRMGSGAEGFDEALGKFSAAAQEAYEKLGRGAVERAARGEKPRADLVTARTGQEDPMQTIRRLEEAVLKTDIPKQQLDEQKKTNSYWELLMEMLRRQQNRPEPRPDLPPPPPVVP